MLQPMKRLIGTCFALVFLAGTAAATNPEWPAAPTQWAFDVYRGDDLIGHHTVLVAPGADGTHEVSVDIDLEISFGPITLFRYRHESQEVWQDGRLQSLRSTTDDDGEDLALAVDAVDGGLQVEGKAGSFLAPSDILTTTYWRPDTVEQSSLLDTQSGRLVAVDVRPLGVEKVAVVDDTAEAKAFEMTGDLRLQLWYDTAGDWVKLSFDGKGEDVIYRRQAGPLPDELQSAER